MKIAFIIGPQGGKWQGTYYDKFLVDKSRPWLENIPSKYYIDDDGNVINKKSENKYVRIDVSVFYALKYYLHKDHTLVGLEASSLTEDSFKNYDLVINQFMDLLIVPFIKKYEQNKIPHEKLRILYEKYQDKIYPPVQYANLIYDKCKYYDYLRNLNFNIAPTVCVSKGNYDSLELAKKFIDMGWTKVFAKPVYGTDSVDTKLISGIYKSKLSQAKSNIEKYIQKTFKQDRYPKIVFQKYMKDFENTVPQIRMYYVGDTYQYSVLTMNDGTTYRPKTDVSKNYNIEHTRKFGQLKALKEKSSKILKNISRDYFGNTPKLVTRIDYGCCTGNSRKPNNFFVNEIEFNPGMYLHVDGQRKFNMDKKIALQLIKVIKLKNHV
jgi:hypothetical protein